ncbi:MAG TPA: DUF1573 domain-containing protein [Candidatus Hydrogenedentes bacterium]|nr:DUF1573 domain-containing protein [Candidatus Hydrogenedentota bacterium]
MANPKIKVPDVVHLGVLQSAPIMQAEFPIANGGSSDLTIDRVSMSCSCVSVELSSETVAPGEEALVKVSFDREKLREGPVYLGFFTNDPEYAVRSILLNFGLLKNFALKPARLRIAKKPNEPVRETVEVIVRRGPPVTLSQVTCTSAAVKTRIVRDSGRSLLVEVIVPDTIEGLIKAELSFLLCESEQTAGGEQTVLSMPVRVVPRPHFQFTPTKLFLCRSLFPLQEDRVWREFELRVEQDATIESITSDIPGIRFESEKRAANHFRITSRLIAAQFPSVFVSDPFFIRIKMENDEREHKLEVIPIR